MTPSLKMATEEFTHQEINLNSSIDGNENYFLPEKIKLSLPKEVVLGQEFAMIVGKQITEDLYKQIKIDYETTGKLSGLTSEVYNLELK